MQDLLDVSPHARRLTGELPVRAVALVQSALAVALLALICFMLPVQQQHHNHRLPPRWEPGLGSSLPFRTWLQDLRLWTTTTDLELEPHRQAAAIISQLGGASCDLARTLSPQEIFNGGSSILRIRAAQDLLHFQRRGNETIELLITRFEAIRARARSEGGGANVSTESASLILLRAVGVTAEQFSLSVFVCLIQNRSLHRC